MALTAQEYALNPANFFYNDPAKLCAQAESLEDWWTRAIASAISEPHLQVSGPKL